MSYSKQILTLLPKVRAEIGGIEKDSRNQKQGYSFRGIDAALNHCGPILARNGISHSAIFRDCEFTEHFNEAKDRFDTRCSLYLDLEFIAPDGSSIKNTTRGEGQDFGGDKATNKAMSAAMKYGLFMGLMIPVDDEIEDSDRDDAPKAQPRQQPAPATAQHAAEKRALWDYMRVIGLVTDPNPESIAVAKRIWAAHGPNVERCKLEAFARTRPGTDPAYVDELWAKHKAFEPAAQELDGQTSF